jgi:hypothetical protein
MVVRHRNLLQVANFLRTRVEPVLVSVHFKSIWALSSLTNIQLWRPYQLRDEDEDTIARQRQEANDIISKEEADFEEGWRRRERKEETEERGIEKESNTKDGLSEEPREANETSNEEKPTTPQEVDSNSRKEAAQGNQEKARTGSTSSATDRGDQSTDGTHIQSTQRPDDEGEEVMEEDKEDMVLY